MSYQFKNVIQAIKSTTLVDTLIIATTELITLTSDFFIQGLLLECTDFEESLDTASATATIGFNSPDYNNLISTSIGEFTSECQANNISDVFEVVLPANIPLFCKINIAEQMGR